jgi:hypothetical protein
MTQPPQQPGPYGQDPHGQQPEQFGTQQPDPYGQEQPPGFLPPPKSRAGLITAVVIGAVLVLIGGGTGVYFLTKGDGSGSTATNTSQKSAPQTQQTVPSGSGTPTAPKSSDPAPTSGSTPTSSGGEGGGGGGGGTGGADDAQIVQIAEKYAKAVTGKDEAGAKSVTCDNDSGLLYTSAEKVEVVGKPEKYGDDTASINVKITIGASEPIDNFPLFMDKKTNGWCISN